MIKTTWAEWKLFYEDDEYWDELFLSDEKIYINGIHVLDDIGDYKPDAIVKITGGYLYREGPLGVEEPIIRLSNFFNKWKEQQLTTLIVVRVPKEELNNFIEYCNSIDCELVIHPERKKENDE